MVITIIATASHPRPAPWKILLDNFLSLRKHRVDKKKKKKKKKKEESGIYDAVISFLSRSFAAPSADLIATRG